MSFQPFGYRFDVKSRYRPGDVKAAIRARKKGWFHPATGARGWILGPFLCLWLNMFDRHGPMLIGRITGDTLGSRISGRAGSDLNGVAMLALLAPFLAFVLFKGWSSGQMSGPGSLLVFGCTLLLIPIALWIHHSDRKQAEPLVRFLRDAISPDGTVLRSRSKATEIELGLALEISGKEHPGPVTTETVHDALLDSGTYDFVILRRASEDYIQSGSRDGRYLIERRAGDHLHHYRAARPGAPVQSTTRDEFPYDFEETLAAFIAYASEAPMPACIRWHRIEMPPGEAGGGDLPTGSAPK